MTGYTRAGVVHHAESIMPGPDNTILHTYWSDGKYVTDRYTREAFLAALDDEEQS